MSEGDGMNERCEDYVLQEGESAGSSLGEVETWRLLDMIGQVWKPYPPVVRNCAHNVVLRRFAALSERCARAVPR